MQRPSPRFKSERYLDISYARFPEKCFTQIYRALYENVMLVPCIRIGTNMATGKQ